MKIMILIVFTLITGVVSVCNSSFPYTYNTSCYAECPWNPPVVTYLDPLSNNCLTTCTTSGYYADDYTKTCTQNCSISPIITYKDTNTSKCVRNCSSNPSQYAYITNYTCLTYCVSPYYADDQTRTCVLICPPLTYYQISGSIRICTSRCFPNFYANESRMCIAASSCPSSPVKYYADDSTNLCVKTCPANSDTYADDSPRRCVHHCTLGTFGDPLNLQCVSRCSQSPLYFGSNATRRCQLICLLGSFGDTISGQCVQLCPNNTFGDYVSRRCVSTCPISNNTYADPVTRLCVAVCSPSYYANNDTRSCVFPLNCSGLEVANPVNLQCVAAEDCSDGYFVDWTNKICVTKCPSGTWSNLDNKYCQSSCRWNPPTYVTWKLNETLQCVKQCPGKPRSFGDNATQTCVDVCPNNTYGDTTIYTCVLTCADGYHAVAGPNLCVSDCTTNTSTILYLYKPNTTCVLGCPPGYYADNTTLTCVTRCPNNTYGYQTNHTCIEGCPAGLYADKLTQTCVSICSYVTGYFADNSTNMCTKVCPVVPDYFGQDINNGNRICVLNCTNYDNFADPLTRLCVKTCNLTAGYFGYLTTKRCVLTCPTGYGEPVSKICVDVCPQTPYQSFGDNLTKTCVTRCPNSTYGDKSNELCVKAIDCLNGTYGDDSNNLCVAICSTLLDYYGDPVTKKCVPVCPFGYYADQVTRLCATNCTSVVKLYTDPSTRRCVRFCPSTPDLFNDDYNMSCVPVCNSGFASVNGISRKCVSVCPTSPSQFADHDTKTCVSQCANGTYRFFNSSYRGCMKYCPPYVLQNKTVDLYADNTTWRCVSACPLGYFAYKDPLNSTIMLCVVDCRISNSTYYFADSASRKCVVDCPMEKYLTYGDRINFKCMYTCTRKQFTDNTTKQCQYKCSSGYYADNTTYRCVDKCPNGTFAEQTNRTCVKYCPKSFYGHQNKCISLCPNNTIYFSDNTTWRCVTVCPTVPDYYADPQNQLCVDNCTLGYFSNPYTRKCGPALNCTNNTVADPTTYRCVSSCTKVPMYFVTNTTNLCTPNCVNPLLADNSTNKCVTICPSPYFGVNSTANYFCVEFCPNSTFKNSGDRMCVVNCPNGTYADFMTMSCVTRCPDKYFGNSSNTQCVLNCTPLYASDANRTCESVCPNNTAASNTTFKCQTICDYGYFDYNKICMSGCPNGTFADNLTRKCGSSCPNDPFTYADPFVNKCVFNCSSNYFAYDGNRTCNLNCPDGLFKDLTLNKCLNVCLPGFFGNPENQTCVTSCSLSNYSLADPTTQQCVVKCPQVPDLYGTANECKAQCPVGKFAQNFTRTCVDICPNVTSFYLNASWADELTRRCVRRCSALSYAMTNITDNYCVNICPNGTFASEIDQACVTRCPNTTFAQNTSKTCVEKCPIMQFGDSHLNLCVQFCTFNDSEYADNSTQTCTANCSTIPDQYAQQSTNQCVLKCQSGFFAYNETRKCVDACPSPYFKDLQNRLCVLDCPIHNLTYAHNNTRTCVSLCLNVTVGNITTIMYSDNSTRKCVSQCPSNPKFYGINATNICHQKCPNGTFGDNDTRICLDKCVFQSPKFTWMDSVNNFCVKYCPQTYFADNYTFKCEPVCSNGTFADNSTNRCVFMCPVNPSSFGYIVNKTCIYICPDGLFADEVTRNCIPKCPVSPFYYLHYTVTNKCVKQCIYPYFGELSSQNCVNKCQDGFYGNLTTHYCEKCRTQCITCSAYLQCLSCAAGFYLYQFQCVTSCPSYPTLYFAHLQSATCFLKCPQPFFGLKSSGLCQLSCPVSQYANTDTRRCTNCPSGCITCDMNGCYTCLATYVWNNITLTCNKECNSTHKYFFGTTCYSICPNGTLLSPDKVNCIKCNELCATCSVTAVNCTKCANKFLYLGACIDQCPQAHFVDTELSCVACVVQPSKCLLEPLTYIVKPFTQNFKYNCYVIFNRAVSLTLSDFVTKVQLKLNGATVKPSQFTASVFNKTTYKVVFITTSSSSLNQNSLNVGFTPGSIGDSFGNILTVNSVGETFKEQVGVNEQISNTSTALSATTNYITWLLFGLLALFMLKGGYPILITVQAIQIIHMHSFLLLDPMPYLQYKIFDSIKHFNFMFLPSLFAIQPQYTNPKYDYFWTNTSFLNNSSPFIIVLGLAVVVYVIFNILTSKSILNNKPVRKFAKYVKKYRLKYSIFNDGFWFTYLIVMFVTITQFKQVRFDGIWNIINILFAAIVFAIYMLYTFFVTYLGFHYRKDLTKIPKKYAFMLPEPSAFPLQIPFRFSRKFLICLALIIPHGQTQIVILLMVNIVFFIFWICFMPVESRLTNTIIIIVEVGYIIIESLFYAYSQLKFKTLDEQMGFAITITVVEAVLLIILIVWVVYRFIVAFREIQCLKQFIAKVTANNDPQYLKQEQRKRDLQFDFGSVENKSDVGTHHVKPPKLKFLQKQFGPGLNQSVDNIFQNKDDTEEQASSKNFGRLSSPFSDQNNPLFEPRKTKNNIKPTKGKNLLQINEIDKYSDLEEIKLVKNSSKSKKNSEKDKLQQKQVKQSEKESQNDKKVIWDDIDFDENQI